MAIELKSKNYLYAILVVSGSLLLIIILSFLIVKPLWESNSKIKQEVLANEQKLASLEDRLTKLKKYKEKEAELLKEKEKVLAVLPEDKDIPRLFVQFEKMVATTGASVVSADTTTDSAVASTGQVQQQQAVPGVTTYNYNLKVNSSTYEAIKNIVLNSESALRLMNISGFSISKKEGSFDVIFTLKSYARSQQ
ncbi:MAG: hypothetical protein M1355_00775 [Patescibacteria group bacterium]|nr:hypothetical protein [Patescibacteria group bacterium]MCL5093660.1 hypothetical protein [Patescibacteria group bacterium]